MDRFPQVVKNPRLLISAVLALLGLGLLLGAGKGIEKWTLQDAVSRKAALQIDDALEKNLTVFATVSGIKAVMALVEGSSVGVGFELEVGDLIQPAYDYIDWVWKLFLYAIFVLTLYKLLVESGLLTLGLPILGCGFILLGLSVFRQRSNRAIRAWARSLITLGLLVAYGIPLILLGSQALGDRFISPLKEKAAKRIQATAEEFTQAKTEFLTLKDKMSLLSPGESMEQVRLSLDRIVSAMTSAAWESSKTFLYYVTILLVELLLLPFLMALLIYFLLHTALARLQTVGLSPRTTESVQVH